MKRAFKMLVVLITLIIGMVAGAGLSVTSLIPDTVSQFLDINDTTGYYNIVDYGAESDRPSFDNAEIFNEVIEEMGNEGGTIYIPAGNYYIKSPIKISRSYISVVGDNSGLRSGVDEGNATTQAGGGGAKLIASPGVTAFQIEDEQHNDRISGITFKSFQIRGQSNNGIGIEGIQDTDRIVIDDMVINNVGVGVQLHGADAPSIRNSWIAETESSIILNGASQQASIMNNSLGAQPSGTTIELENAQWFNISGNNIYPDGSSNIRLYNPNQGNIASNTISSRYNGMIELLPNAEGELGSGNLITGNVVSVVEARTHPKGRDKDWGILHIEAHNTNISSNQILAERMPEDYVGILIEQGDGNRISSNSIGVENSSSAKVTTSSSANNTLITDSIFNNEFRNDGNSNNLNEPLPN